MAPTLTFRESTKKVYDFAFWPASNIDRAMPAHLHGGFELSSFAWSKRYPLANWRNAYTDVYLSTSDPEVALNVEIIECLSNESAREALLDQLSNSMAPRLPQLIALQIEAGEIGFGGHEELQTQLIFVRGRVLVKVQSTGSKPVSVVEPAQQIDRQLRME